MQLESLIAMAEVQASATGPIGSLAWEPPYAASAALKKKKKEKKKNKTKKQKRAIQNSQLANSYYI